MKLIHLQCGLGNQMFQYAFAKSLGSDIWFRDEFYNEENRNLELHKLNCKLYYKTSLLYKIIHPLSVDLKQFKIVDENEAFKYNPEFYKMKGKIYFKGFFQNENYFKKYRQELLKEFVPRKKLDKKNDKILNEIKSSNSVSVHIRRTDYKDLNIDIDLEYYKKAIEYMTNRVEDPVFYFFSDDMDYVIQNFSDTKLTCKFINHNNKDNCYKDLFLMKNCKHNIITNSTFSWWGAWLNENPEKIVICPKQWFKDNIYSNNLLLDEWIKI